MNRRAGIAARLARKGLSHDERETIYGPRRASRRDRREGVMTPADFTAHRMRTGLSQGGLAEVLGVARVTVAQWEQGRRTVPEWAARLMRLVNFYPKLLRWLPLAASQ